MKKVNRLGNITADHMSKDFELSTEFIRRNKFSLNPTVIQEVDFDIMFEDLYPKLRREVEEAKRQIQPHLNSYAQKNEDSPTWFVTNTESAYEPELLEIMYNMYSYMFLSDDLLTGEQKEKYKLTGKEIVIIAKALTMSEGTFKKMGITADMKRCLERFNKEAIGGFVRHMDKSIVYSNLESILQKIVDRDEWPEVEVVPSNDHKQNPSLYAALSERVVECECDSCERRNMEIVPDKMTTEEISKMEPNKIKLAQNNTSPRYNEPGLTLTDKRNGIDVEISPVIEGVFRDEEDIIVIKRKEYEDREMEYNYNYAGDPTFYGLRIILEFFSKRSRRKLAYVSKAWYAAVKSNPMFLRNTESFFF